MSLGSFSDQDDDNFNPELNTTPMIDVMLVLLMVFMISFSAATQRININVPKTQGTITSNPNNKIVNIAINEQGTLYWNTEIIRWDQLKNRTELAAQQQPQPEIHISAARTTLYDTIAKLMSTIQTSGITSISLVTAPESSSSK